MILECLYCPFCVISSVNVRRGELVSDYLFCQIIYKGQGRFIIQMLKKWCKTTEDLRLDEEIKCAYHLFVPSVLHRGGEDAVAIIVIRY
jgi:hypothetical protein